MSADAVKMSKFLSLVLRHEPQRIGIELDEAGWVDVAELLEGFARHGAPIAREQLDTLVRTSDKQRFAFSDDGSRIRANQGHSVEVELNHSIETPPDVLYHGTVARSLDSIRAQGLLKGQRHHVHLSPTRDIATQVGQRRGRPVVLIIDAKRMSADGLTFYRTPNNVWLVDAVPPQYIEIQEDQ